MNPIDVIASLSKVGEMLARLRRDAEWMIIDSAAGDEQTRALYSDYLGPVFAAINAEAESAANIQKSISVSSADKEAFADREIAKVKQSAEVAALEVVEKV